MSRNDLTGLILKRDELKLEIDTFKLLGISFDNPDYFMAFLQYMHVLTKITHLEQNRN